MRFQTNLSRLPIAYTGKPQFMEVRAHTSDIHDEPGIYLQKVEGCGYDVYQLTLEEATEIANNLLAAVAQSKKEFGTKLMFNEWYEEKYGTPWWEDCGLPADKKLAHEIPTRTKLWQDRTEEYNHYLATFIDSPITVADLAYKLSVKMVKVISFLAKKGQMVTVNQVLSASMANMVVREMK